MFFKKNVLPVILIPGLALSACQTTQPEHEVFCWAESQRLVVSAEKWDRPAALNCTPVRAVQATPQVSGGGAAGSPGPIGHNPPAPEHPGNNPPAPEHPGNPGNGSAVAAGGGSAAAAGGGASAAAGGGSAAAAGGGASAAAGGGSAAAAGGGASAAAGGGSAAAAGAGVEGSI
jgi:hypothetical protein